MRVTNSPTVGMSLIRPIAVPTDQIPASTVVEHLATTDPCDQVLDVVELTAIVENLDHLTRLAEQLDVTESARDVCALGLRLQSVLEELDNMPQSGPVSKADEIAERRRQRRAQHS
jgi:hypothetical protein